MSIAIVQGTAVLPDRLLENAVVCVDDGQITSICAGGRVPRGARIVDARGGFILPGFIDMHVHGGGGADFMDGTDEAVAAVCRAHARHGTTTLFPTTTTGSFEQIMAMIDACGRVQARDPATGGARIEGVHLYGPYFAEDKTGCHSAAGRRAPVAEEYQQYFASRMIRIATCAAELPGAVPFFQMARRHHCLMTCGHSNASYTEMRRAFTAGMRHVDHFWCAMSSVPSIRQRLGVPMQGSMQEFVLATADMSTEVIADGMHLAPELLQFAARMKGPERLCLVTDCNRALDMPPGRYRFGSLDDGTWFESDGHVGWASPESLASSVRGMDHMVRHMKKSTSLPLWDVVRMASLTPAERTGIADRTGSLEPGKRADLLLTTRRLIVKRVWLNGIELLQD